MAISYAEVEEHYNKIKPPTKASLQILDDLIFTGREDHNLPVYLTKYRVKSKDSIYLKTKRKNKETLDEITDYGGLRVLCLFEQDIYPVHEYLINLLKNNDFELTEFKIFNWSNQDKVAQLNNFVKKHFPIETPETDPKESGYKSIHYVVQPAAGAQIEIQLRTLLQDVWAELEHSLSYKQGNIHPHIKKSFYLLSRDLATDDELIKHLREINDKEKNTELFALSNTGPYNVFSYEDDDLPTSLEIDTKIKEAHKEYSLLFTNTSDIKKRIQEIEDAYVEIIRTITILDADSVEVKFWVDMEKAYIEFYKGNFDVALEKYNEVINYTTDCYVPYFRKGEILFIQGFTEKALAAFDICEEILRTTGKQNDINAYRVKVKLANIYWLMGSEYNKISLNEILQAESIFKENKEKFSKKDEKLIINNLCWYQLAQFITKAENNNGDYKSEELEDDFVLATQRFCDLEPLLKNDDVNGNTLDTASWYCYIAYKRLGDTDYLIRAKELCKLGWGKENSATLTITSVNIHRNHTQEIMNTNP